jgi:hypothetical protein
MSIPKIIQTGSFKFAEAATAIVPLHRNGCDHRWMEKRASKNVFAKEIAKIAADGGVKGHSVLHVIIVGDHERYGFNRNGDAFSGEDNVTAHTGFKDHGNHFAHHKNDDPQKKTGSVLATAYNDTMSRIELLTALDNTKYAEELSEFEKGGDIPYSMGSMQAYDVCFPAGTPIEVRNGVRAIETICIGDLVRTHTGALRPVSALFKRLFTGTAVELNVRGVTESVVATANHPILALRYEHVHCGQKCGGGNRRRLDVTHAGFPTPAWTAAGELSHGDYVGYPVPVGGSLPYGVEAAYAVGFAYGDGSVFGKKTKTMGWRYRGVQYSTDLADTEITDRLRASLAKSGRASHHYPHVEKSESTVMVCAPDFGCEVDQLVGRGSKTKYVSDEILAWDAASRRGFIGGLLDSDGSVDPTGGDARICTTSHGGAEGIRRILLSLDIVCGTHTAAYSNEEFNSSGTVHVVHINAHDIHGLRDVSIRAARHARDARVRESAFIADGYAWYPIASITAQEVVGLTVYNLSVEQDETYIAGGIQVHNCSICGHKAPEAKDHCHHIQQKLGEVLADGRFVGMLNPNPYYFDASTVWKPADRIGYALAKVASENGVVGGHQLAESMGIRPWGSVKQGTLMHLASIEKRLSGVGKLVSTAPGNLSAETIKHLKTACSRHGVASVLGYLHKTGALLSFADFTEVVVGQNKFASAVDIDESLLTNGFTRLAAASDEVGELDGDPEHADIGLNGDADDELDATSGMKAASVQRRVLRQAIIVPTVKTAGFGDPLKARGLADLYLHYKLAFANHPANRDNPFVLQAVVLSQSCRPHSDP